MNQIPAPFTAEQVASINGYQKSGVFHEFTCGKDHDGDRALRATVDGLECPTCDYRQFWVHEFMANGLWALPLTWAP